MENRIQHLENKINRRVDTTRKSKRFYKYLFRYLSLFLAGLAALNTFLVAMSQYGEEPNANYGVCALIVSAILAVISSFEASLNPKDKFIKNADALNEVVDLRERWRWRKLKKEEAITEQELQDEFEKFRSLEKGFFSSLAKSNIVESE